MRSLQLLTLLTLLATARADQFPIVNRATDTVTGGFYSCYGPGNGSQNVLLNGARMTIGGGLDSAEFSPCDVRLAGDSVLRVNGGIGPYNLGIIFAGGPWPCTYSFDGCFVADVELGITGADILLNPLVRTYKEPITWSADVGAIASGSPYCDVTGGEIWPGIWPPCDFAAMAADFPPDHYPQLYTLYQWTASGRGSGTVTVNVGGSGEIDVSYALTGVPEPSSFLLLATAAGIAWLMRGSRRMA